MQTDRVMVIGTGRHAGRNIYPSLRELGAQVTAVASRHADEAAACARSWNPDGRGYGDYKKMLAREDAERVLVVTGAAAAPAIVRDCLTAGKTVFVEKPLGMDRAQAEQVARLAEERRGIVQVGFMKRFAPCYRMLRERLEQGELGPVRSFRFIFDVSAARFCASDRDFIYYVAIHGLDLMRYLFGEPVELAAYKNAAGSGNSYQILLRMENGCVGACGFENRAAHTMEQERLEVTFEDGYACAENLTGVTLRRAGSGEWRALSESEQRFVPTLSPSSGPARDLYLRGFVGELRHFLSPGLADQSGDNVRTAALCDEILRLIE